MFFRLLLAFTVIPLAELYLLLRIADWAGWRLTLGLVIATGLAGAALARWQGTRALARLREQLQAGRSPSLEIGEGVLILVAAVVLITPGVMTDALGLALLTPPIRRWLCRRLIDSLKSKIETGVAYHASRGGGSEAQPGSGRSGDERVVDTEFADEGETEDRSAGG